MFRLRPDATAVDFGLDQANDVPGFRVTGSDEGPGFRVRQPDDVPGFRVNSDGSTRPGYPTAGGPSSAQPVRWAGEPAGYPNGRSDSQGPVTLGDFFARALNRIGTEANAVVNGAYSVFPGVSDAGRAVARGTGLMGQEEFRRFGQEADFIGRSLGRIAQDPGTSARIAGRALSELRKNPLFWHYMTGRAAMGISTGLGPAAMAGNTLRAIENGHDLIDVLKYSIQGWPPAER